ncbi:hypothetical protein ASD64_01360 [Mesorhizobium sp. Root157]|uniref:hypothetical protein n=1 Tax=Mesorhizobium sp. Root157 TaxID=1736477 RepID=UPI0006F1EB9E|nr:hypothetical protein [Mesorhizobium sp. Root157]KRA00250.1 hypothetical protein ASD64_01360 [Mesorhizobium sp. Root157]
MTNKLTREQSAAEIAEACREFSRQVGDDKTAATLLGLPKKTFDNMKQGRGYAHPVLFFHALARLKESMPS